MVEKCRIGRHLDEATYTINDARGIPLGIVCQECEAEVKSKFRPDVLSDSNYWSDEPVEPDDWF
jgi:hypothetical protein